MNAWLNQLEAMDFGSSHLSSNIILTFCICFARCKCAECTIENLSDAVEYRCCREIAQVRQKLMFDGSSEQIS